ncbi:MAG: hypothetical protein K0S61_2258 [Anaerocolumna sp.]|jgi:maltose-binding protein MalE|nr:hypothetical protein [Anaerocolumna sp.]
MYNIANGGIISMKKIIISILSIFLLASVATSCGLNSKNTNSDVNKPKEEKIVIDKSNFDSYSTTLLKAINHSFKKGKDLDGPTKNDIEEYLTKYHGDDFYTNKSLSTDYKNKVDDVFLTSINLKSFFEAKQSKDTEKIATQQKILTELLNKYSF